MLNNYVNKSIIIIAIILDKVFINGGAYGIYKKKSQNR